MPALTWASSSGPASRVPMPLISPSKRLKPSCTSRVSTSTWLLAVLSLSKVTSRALEWYLHGTHHRNQGIPGTAVLSP